MVRIIFWIVDLPYFIGMLYLKQHEIYALGVLRTVPYFLSRKRVFSDLAVLERGAFIFLGSLGTF